MLSFQFAGKDSYKDFGILIEKRPVIPSPQRRVTSVVIPGRSSSLKYDENTYEDITIAIECSIKDNVYDRVDEIKSWLLGSGESDLIFSFQNDRKYIAQVVNSIDFSVALRISSHFIIVFTCHPFKYEAMDTTLNVLSSGAMVFNPGSYFSEPIIKITGSGDISLKINTQEISIKNSEGNIILNSVLMDAYDLNLNNLNGKVAGELPKLETGENFISWNGNITRMEIVPNWRWL